MTTLIGANILMAMLGGLFGALRSLVSAGDRQFNKGFLNVIVGIGLAAMVVEQWVPNAGVWGGFGIGILIGSAGGHTIDAVLTLIPQIVQSFVAGWIEKLGGKKDQ